MQPLTALAFIAPLGDVRLEPVITFEDILLMIRACVIENHVTDHNKQLLALARKSPGQRILARDIHQPFAHPIPELSLGGPELVIVSANYARGLFCLCH